MSPGRPALGWAEAAEPGNWDIHLPEGMAVACTGPLAMEMDRGDGVKNWL